MSSMTGSRDYSKVQSYIAVTLRLAQMSTVFAEMILSGGDPCQKLLPFLRAYLITPSHRAIDFVRTRPRQVMIRGEDRDSRFFTE